MTPTTTTHHHSPARTSLATRAGAGLLGIALAFLGACASGSSSNVLFVNATSSPLLVQAGANEPIAVAPGKSATSPLWASATSLTIIEGDAASPSAPRYQVALARSGPATITARGPAGQVAFNVTDPRQDQDARERQIQRDVLERAPSRNAR